MKSLVQKLTTAAAAALALALSMPEANAAKITLDGYGYYALKTKVTYYGSAPKQSGRYSTLGSDYYHKLAYRMDFLTNRSNSSSGSLSYEFWAMPYYGATTGIVLLTRSVQPMRAQQSIKNASKEGLGVFLDARKFPEMNIWEYTRKGWKFRDALSFTRKIRL